MTMAFLFRFFVSELLALIAGAFLLAKLNGAWFGDFGTVLVYFFIQFLSPFFLIPVALGALLAVVWHIAAQAASGSGKVDH
jgi:hypothetical protein